MPSNQQTPVQKAREKARQARLARQAEKDTAEPEKAAAPPKKAIDRPRKNGGNGPVKRTQAKAEEPAKKELVETKATQLAVPEGMDDICEASGTGFEGVTAQDLAIPYLVILQTLSPQVRKGAQRIEGAEEGNIFNTVTQECYEDVTIIPCAYRKCWVEWVPRDAGGGFVQQHFDRSIMSDATQNDKRRWVLKNGNNIVETAYHFVLRLDEDGGVEQAVMALASTALKASRRWMHRQMNQQLVIDGQRFNPPPYAYAYAIDTLEDSNVEGTWSTWNISAPTFVDDRRLRDLGRDFAKAVKEDQVTVGAPPTTESNQFDDDDLAADDVM